MLPRGTIAKVMAFQGPVLKRCADHKMGYWVIRNITHGGVARFTLRAARRIGLLKGLSPIETVVFVMRYFFETHLELRALTDTEVHFCLLRCPYGWKGEGDVNLCDAVMQFERELAKGIGTMLVIEERIPDGAPACRFRVRVADVN